MSTNKSTDKRTRLGREIEVLEKIKEDGGVNLYWATENQGRASAIDRLIASGSIKCLGGQFPFNRYKVVSPSWIEFKARVSAMWLEFMDYASKPFA